MLRAIHLLERWIVPPPPHLLLRISSSFPHIIHKGPEDNFCPMFIMVSMNLILLRRPLTYDNPPITADISRPRCPRRQCKIVQLRGIFQPRGIFQLRGIFSN